MIPISWNLITSLFYASDLYVRTNNTIFDIVMRSIKNMKNLLFTNLYNSLDGYYYL